jgi:hypothetical protein
VDSPGGGDHPDLAAEEDITGVLLQQRSQLAAFEPAVRFDVLHGHRSLRVTDLDAEGFVVAPQPDQVEFCVIRQRGGL